MSETNEWSKWIEEAISKKHIKHYEYNHFKNIQEIGIGGFGKVYRAKWKKSPKYFALKSLLNIDEDAIKELVNEIELQREVIFHDNIINFYGITISDQENQSNDIKKYLLVMEYADGGSLSHYLKENFKNLTWEDKFNLADQLASAVSCLHDEDIIHRDLHSNNVLISKNIIKLADFGLSKRIEETTQKKKDIFGVVPYIDPKKFSNRSYSLNKKSDVYSVGVLLWEISSGKPPFYVEGESYDGSLAIQIIQGLRETAVPDTPIEYVKLYTECWDDNPDNRPSTHDVVERLNLLINQKQDENLDEKLGEITNQTENKDTTLNSNNVEVSSHGELSKMIQDFDKMDVNQILNENITLNNVEESSRGELSRIVKDFDKMDTKEIMESMTTTSEEIINNKNISFENDLIIKVNKITEFIFEVLNKRNSSNLKQKILDYINNQKMNSKEIYNWLCDNQNYNSNSIFLFGFFNFYGIETIKDNEKSINLFINASEQDFILAQYFIGLYYQSEYETSENKKLAFEYYEKVANKDCAIGQLMVGYCYDCGLGIKEESKIAIDWYEKSANNGNIIAMCNLGFCYKYGKSVGIEKDIDKAIYWYKKAIEQGDSSAQIELEELIKKSD